MGAEHRGGQICHPDAFLLSEGIHLVIGDGVHPEDGLDDLFKVDGDRLRGEGGVIVSGGNPGRCPLGGDRGTGEADQARQGAEQGAKHGAHHGKPPGIVAETGALRHR